MKLVIAFVVGVLVYLVAQFVFNEVISALIGVLAFLVIAFADRARRIN